MDLPSQERIKGLKVEELKEYLAAYGQSTVGVKATLSQRLANYVEEKTCRKSRRSKTPTQHKESTGLSEGRSAQRRASPASKRTATPRKKEKTFTKWDKPLSRQLEKATSKGNSDAQLETIPEVRVKGNNTIRREESLKEKGAAENPIKENATEEKVKNGDETIAKERCNGVVDAKEKKPVDSELTKAKQRAIGQKLLESMQKHKLKLAKKKKKKKLRKEMLKSFQRTTELTKSNANGASKASSINVEVIYVDQTLDIKGLNVVKIDDSTMQYIDGAYQQLEKEIYEEEEKKKKAEKQKRREEEEAKEEEEIRLEELGRAKLSKKKLRKETQLSVAELKTNVNRPDLVEVWDANSRDPMLLIHLKSCRNTVPVPQHWCQKRKYLQAKRGLEKSTFDLPQFIADTGVAEMRAALSEKEEMQGLRAKGRERVRPKMGKLEIDYQKLHDAFFRYSILPCSKEPLTWEKRSYQTKPRMTIHGNLYYESKEYETSMTERKPGDLSDELKTALGIPLSAEGILVPPPWLIQMQRHGPPPSYPQLRIRGLNAPIPHGAQFGYHPGGWGKPPVDQNGVPLYGDVFGTEAAKTIIVRDDDIDKKSLWGNLQEQSDESSEEESSDEESEHDISGTRTDSGLETPSGIASVPAGLETPDHLELRKRKQIEEEMDTNEQKPLYTVLPEKKAESKKGIMASNYVYDLGAGKTKGVDVALDPSELEDDKAVRARYEQKLKEQTSAPEDFSDMVAAHAAQQTLKRKKKQEKEKTTKKYKDVF